MAITVKAQQPISREQLTSEDGYHIQPGDTIYCSHHGSNGTFLKFFVVKPLNNDTPGDCGIFNITWHVAYALGRKPRDKDGEWMIHNPVYGMDRGFDVVHQLSRVLFHDDYAISHRWL